MLSRKTINRINKEFAALLLISIFLVSIIFVQTPSVEAFPALNKPGITGYVVDESLDRTAEGTGTNTPPLWSACEEDGFSAGSHISYTYNSDNAHEHQYDFAEGSNNWVYVQQNFKVTIDEAIDDICQIIVEYEGRVETVSTTVGLQKGVDIRKGTGHEELDIEGHPFYKLMGRFSDEEFEHVLLL